MNKILFYIIPEIVRNRTECKMRNLQLLYQKSAKIQFINTERPICVAQSKNGDIYIGNSHSIQLWKVVFNEFSSKMEKIIPDLDETDFIISLEYLENSRSLCVGTSKGFIIEWEDVPLGDFVIQSEIVDGITCMKWKYDQLAYAVHSNIGGIFIWDCYFQNQEYIANMQLNPHEPSISESQAVGWGKKSTQFIGQGKKPTLDGVTQLPSKVIDYDDSRVIMSWRKDGEYFAISAIDDNTGYRRIRVWSGKGELFSTCELTPSLCPVLAWIPSECWITSAARVKDNYEIIHFEKNGLRRGGFPLINCSIEERLLALEWNSTSDFLAVQIKSELTTKVQIYKINNFHWYLKSEIDVPQESIISFTWLTFQSYSALIHTEVNSWYFEWDFETDQPAISNNGVSSLVAVQDGPYIQFTPFFIANPPPPYSMAGVKLPFIPSSISISSYLYNRRARVLAVNSPHDYFVIIDVDVSRTDQLNIREVGGCEYKLIQPIKNTTKYNLRHLRWINSNTIFAVDYSHEKSADNIVIFEITQDFIFKLIYTTQLEFEILCVSEKSDNDFLYLQSTDRCISKIDIKSGFVLTKINATSDFASKICSVPNEPSKLILLTKLGELFVDEFKLFDYCTGFIVKHNFLLVTIRSNCLYSIPLSGLNKWTTEKPNDGFCRNLEMGSRLVTASYSSSEVVLQMPRGNIEIINPRPLVISQIQELLDQYHYFQAYKLIRRNRIDSNIVFDHNPSEIIKNMHLLIDQFDTASITSLIADLKDVDVTSTTYKFMYYNKPLLELWPTQKMGRICQLIRTLCTTNDESKFKKPIILCLLKEGSQGVESVMKYILSFTAKSNEFEIHDALKFLKLHISSDELYKQALGTYNLELALMAAQATNKDPKDYLGYLEKLEEYPPNYRSFIIDRDLKNYHKALVHIFKCEDKLDICLNFIKDHNLYSSAVSLIAPSSGFYKPIINQYATLLKDKQNYYESALFYTYVESYELAFDQYCECGKYKESLDCLKFDPSILTKNKRESFQILAQILVKNSQYKEAAKIYDKYLDDKTEALRTLISGFKWEDSYYYNRKINMIKTDEIFVASINSRVEVLISKMQASNGTILTKTNRLKTVREEKEELMSQTNPNIYTDYSETESFTGSSISSGSSSTRKRKEKKKKLNSKFYRSKPGTPYEDFALMNDLFNIYESTKNDDNEACEIINVLMLMKRIEEAKNLRLKAFEHRNFLEKYFKIIWTPYQYLGPVKKGLSSPNTDIQPSCDELPIMKIPYLKYNKALAYSILE